MRGEFIGVWFETWREIWLPLIDHEGVPEDIFCELYRELAPALKNPPSVEALADIIDNPVQSREAFEKTGANDFAGERALVAFLEALTPRSTNWRATSFPTVTSTCSRASSTSSACATTCAAPARCVRRCPACSRAWYAICTPSPARRHTSMR